MQPVYGEFHSFYAEYSKNLKTDANYPKHTGPHILPEVLEHSLTTASLDHEPS